MNRKELILVVIIVILVILVALFITNSLHIVNGNEIILQNTNDEIIWNIMW